MPNALELVREVIDWMDEPHERAHQFTRHACHSDSIVRSSKDPTVSVKYGEIVLLLPNGGPTLWMAPVWAAKLRDLLDWAIKVAEANDAT